MYSHVIGGIAHLIQERILSLGTREKVILGLEETLVHYRVYIVPNCIV